MKAEGKRKANQGGRKEGAYNLKTIDHWNMVETGRVEIEENTWNGKLDLNSLLRDRKTSKQIIREHDIIEEKRDKEWLRNKNDA